jgi:hypothetical protein
MMPEDGTAISASSSAGEYGSHAGRRLRDHGGAAAALAGHVASTQEYRFATCRRPIPRQSPDHHAPRPGTHQPGQARDLHRRRVHRRGQPRCLVRVAVLGASGVGRRTTALHPVVLTAWVRYSAAPRAALSVGGRRIEHEERNPVQEPAGRPAGYGRLGCGRQRRTAGCLGRPGQRGQEPWGALACRWSLKHSTSGLNSRAQTQNEHMPP